MMHMLMTAGEALRVGAEPVEPDLPSASNVNSATLEGADPFELDLLALSSATDSTGGDGVEIYSATVDSGGGTVSATSGSFPTDGTVTVDPTGAVEDVDIVITFVVQDIGNSNPDLRLSRTLTITVGAAASEPPAAPTVFSATDAQHSSGERFYVSFSALPASDEPISAAQVRTSSDDSTWNDPQDLAGVDLDTDYSVTGVGVGETTYYQLRFNSVAGEGAWSASDTVVTGYPLQVLNTGGVTIFTLPLGSDEVEIDYNPETGETPDETWDAEITSAQRGTMDSADVVAVDKPRVFGTAEAGETLAIEFPEFIVRDGVDTSGFSYLVTIYEDGVSVGTQTQDTYTLPTGRATGYDLTFTVTVDGVESPPSDVLAVAADGAGSWSVDYGDEQATSATAPAAPAAISDVTYGDGEATATL